MASFCADILLQQPPELGQPAKADTEKHDKTGSRNTGSRTEKQTPAAKAASPAGPTRRAGGAIMLLSIFRINSVSSYSLFPSKSVFLHCSMK